MSATPLPPRMSVGAAKKGKTRKPLRILLHGVPKIGKTKFASEAPAPYFIETIGEQGSGEYDVGRSNPCESWEDLFAAIKSLENDKHDFKTVVIDTLDSFEGLLQEYLCRDGGVSKLMDYGGGFNKWVDAEVTEWAKMISALDVLREKRGMQYILLCHTMVEAFMNPIGENYDRFAMKVQKKSASTIVGAVDVCLFAQHETAYKKDGTRKYKGKSTGARVLHTEWNAAWVAGNRFNLPAKIPLGWVNFDEAMGQPPRPFDTLKVEVASKIEDVKDAETKSKATTAFEKAKKDGDYSLLERLDNRLSAVLGEQEK